MFGFNKKSSPAPATPPLTGRVAEMALQAAVLRLNVLHILSTGGTNTVDVFEHNPIRNIMVKRETLSLSDREISALLPQLVRVVKEDRFSHLYGNGGFPQSCLRDKDILEANLALLSAVAARVPAQGPRP